MWVAPCSCLLALADSKGMKSQAQISLKSMAKSLEKTPCSKKLGKFNPFCSLQKGQRVTYLVWHYPRGWSWEWLLTLATKDTAKVRSWKQEITQTRNQILAATINRELLSSWFFNEGNLKIRFLYIYIYIAIQIINKEITQLGLCRTQARISQLSSKPRISTPTIPEVSYFDMFQEAIMPMLIVVTFNHC